MYGLSDKEKLDFIIKTSKELGITANDFGENTKLSTMGAYNILNGISTNPRTKNLNIMLEFLESKVTGTALDINPHMHVVKEAKANYGEEDLETIIFKRVYEKLKPEIEAQNEKILTLRKDFKRLFDQFMDAKLKEEIKPKKNDKSS